MKKYKDKFDKLENAPVKSLITSLAVPTIITMLVSAIYNMADSYFVGKIDTTSVASIGIVFSVMTLLQAVGFFLGNGSGIQLATLLGGKDKKQAQIYANVAFFTSLMLGAVLAILGIFFSRQLAYLLGTTDTAADAASSYLKYILLGSPFILGSFVLNNQLRAQGSAIYSMAGILSGSILNICIDPIFIFNFKLGVKGAAIATVISQIIGFIILLLGTRRGENLRIDIRAFKTSKEVYLTILKNGMPSLARQGVNTLSNIALNFMASPFGDSAIAGMSVFNRVLFLGFAVVIGIGQGFQPVCSFNNGAKKYDRVYDAYKFIAVVTTIFISAVALIFLLFSRQLISIFRDDSDVIQIGAQALRMQAFALPFVGFCTSSNMLLQSMKISGKATILALARQGICYIPLVLILPRFFGINGLAAVQALADALTLIITIFVALPTIKKLRSLKQSKRPTD